MKKSISGVRPKKFLGQHFLKDHTIAENIALSLTGHIGYQQVLEVGPGMGVLTQFLLKQSEYEVTVIEIDDESVVYLKKHYPDLSILNDDFLKIDHSPLPHHQAIIDNITYNITSQIFFKVLDHRQIVPEVVGMIQKEVADRICSPPGNKAYGILSVLLQAYYTIEYLFTVEPQVFHPPPKVRSAVIRLKRNKTMQLDCDEKLFKKVVKQGFQNRRKTLRNALKPLNLPESVRQSSMLNLRAEQLSVEDFVQLTQQIEQAWKH